MKRMYGLIAGLAICVGANGQSLTNESLLESINRQRAQLNAKGETDPRRQYEAFRDSVIGRYQSFQNEAATKYQKFRSEANSKYADFLNGLWKTTQGKEGEKIPDQDVKPVAPVVIDQKKEPVENRKKDEDRLIENAVVVTPPAVVPPPAPEVVPVVETPKEEEGKPTTETTEEPADRIQRVEFTLFGTTFRVARPEQPVGAFARMDKGGISAKWRELADGRMDGALTDCLRFRTELQLNDWLYLRMLTEYANTVCGGDANASKLLTAYLYANSGYKMRLGISGQRLVLLFASHHQIYRMPYFELSGDKFYPYGEMVQTLDICDAPFNGEAPLSLVLTGEPKFAIESSEPRGLKSSMGVEVKSVVNKNLIDFLNTYPSSALENSALSRWAMTCNMSVSEEASVSLYPQLKKAIEGKSDYDKVALLLNFVQTAFTYEYDDKVWGMDRAFYPVEVLYYPYSDCEDRTALFTRLVRDLTGLRCAIIAYPGHLAAAVKLDPSVKGDKIRANGEEFLICDPTYINSRPGMSMPNLRTDEIQVMALE